tara:strand:+ start:1841 stop:2062 length:222 start_codon:yes stop_codon:yes gene_type:complete
MLAGGGDGNGAGDDPPSPSSSAPAGMAWRQRTQLQLGTSSLSRTFWMTAKSVGDASTWVVHAYIHVPPESTWV